MYSLSLTRKLQTLICIFLSTNGGGIFRREATSTDYYVHPSLCPYVRYDSS